MTRVLGPPPRRSGVLAAMWDAVAALILSPILLVSLCCDGEGVSDRLPTDVRGAPVSVDLSAQAALLQERDETGPDAGAVSGKERRPAERIEIAPGGRLDFYFRVPRAPALTLDALEGAVARLRVVVHPAGGGERTVGELVSPGGFQALPLPDESGGIVRLSVVDERTGGEGETAILVRPVVRSTTAERPHPAPAGRRAGRSAGTRRPHIIVYLVDTLRADHLGTYGYPRLTSPAIDRFADRATLFENAYAQSSWTRPAVASIFTGLAPRFHSTNRRDDGLPEQAETLAEILLRAGYRTAGFITNGNVGSDFGFDQGFGRYRVMSERNAAELHPLSDRVNRRVFRWLRRRAKDDHAPFFLYVHTTDPHSPYVTPPGYRAPFELRRGSPPSAAQHQALKRLADAIDPRFGPEVRTLDPGSLAWMHGLKGGVIQASAERATEVGDLYDAEISFNDASFGAFLNELEHLGFYENSLVVFTADHGEEFFEHGNWEHGTTLYGEQMRIPLIVKFPGQQRGRRRVGLAQQIDLLPTVLEVAGLAATGGHAGASLVGDGDGAPRAAFSYLDLDGIRLESVVDGRYKLIVGRSSTPTAELYDLVADPGETDDLFAERPTVAAYLELLLAEHRASRTTLAPSAATAAPELERKLKALGYLR